MIKWIRPSGSEIETNDSKETIEHCESLGWKKADKPKRKRRTKAEIEAAKEAE